MGGSLEAFKLFVASEKRRQDRADQKAAEAKAGTETGTTQDQSLKAETEVVAKQPVADGTTEISGDKQYTMQTVNSQAAVRA